MSIDPKFKKKLERLQFMFIRELIDGCVECSKHNAICEDHQSLAMSVSDPRNCPEFQEFLKQIGVSLDPKGKAK